MFAHEGFMYLKLIVHWRDDVEDVCPPNCTGNSRMELLLVHPQSLSRHLQKPKQSRNPKNPRHYQKSSTKTYLRLHIDYHAITKNLNNPQTLRTLEITINVFHKSLSQAPDRLSRITKNLKIPQTLKSREFFEKTIHKNLFQAPNEHRRSSSLQIRLQGNPSSISAITTLQQSPQKNSRSFKNSHFQRSTSQECCLQ